MSIWILLGLSGAIIIFVISVYNALVGLRIRSENAWSDIDVHLKKRHNLIPNLVETVKGYAAHEKDTLERVIQARNSAQNAKTVDEQIEAENVLSGMLKQFFALSEAYPDLKANSQFINLQKELSEIEDQVAESRRYYNAVVRDYNTKQQVFPSNVVAGMFSFSAKPFFEAAEAERSVPKVEFN